MKKTESRLSRWSRLKTKDREEQPSFVAPEVLEPQDAVSKTVPIEIQLEPQQPILSDIEIEAPEVEEEIDLDVLSETHDLPKIEDLDKDSDFTGFLDNSIPEALRKAAMRKLWLSDSILANVDGLNDYDEDFNVVDRLISALDTSYQVGKGIVDPSEEEDEENIEEEILEEKEKNELTDNSDISVSQIDPEDADAKSTEHTDEHVEQISNHDDNEFALIDTGQELENS